MLENIKGTFAKDIENNQLYVDKELFLNAKVPDTFAKLRTVILEKAELQEDWERQLPLKWLPLEDEVSRLQKENVKVIPTYDNNTFDETSLDQINKDLVVRLAPKEMEVCLKYKHCLGHLLYFPDRLLREYLILDQVWLIDALKSLVFDKKFAADAKKSKAFSNMELRGIVKDEDREELWSQPQYLELKRYSDHALRVMEKLDIIARPKSYKNGKEIDQPFYYVPWMVKTEPSEMAQSKAECLPPETTITFIFDKCFLPSAAFSRLVTSCLALWPVHKEQLFFGSCVLRLDIFHTMLLKKKDNSIACSIMHKRHPKSTSKRILWNMRRFLKESLCRIVSTYGLARRSTNWFQMDPEQEEVIISLIIIIITFKMKISGSAESTIIALLLI